MTEGQYLVNVSVWRNGTRMTPYKTPQGNNNPTALWFDDTTNDIVFSVEFVDEDLAIRLGGY